MLFIFLVKVSSAQKALPYDSCFTNKREAKNLMINGLKEGKWLIYQDSNANVISDTNAPYYVLIVFRAGIPVVGRGYTRRGSVNFEVPILNGMDNGLGKWYYDDGKFKAEVIFKNSKKNGVEKNYYESGVLESETPYKNDKQNGVEKDYYESGQLKGTYPFKNDEENGVEKEYWENGKLKSKTTFKNGESTETMNWDKDGVPVYYMDDNPLQGVGK